MPRSKKRQDTPKTQPEKTSVVDDFIEQNHSSDQDREEIEVVAENINIANSSVSEVAVVKLSADSTNDDDVTDVKQDSQPQSPKEKEEGDDGDDIEKHAKVADVDTESVNDHNTDNVDDNVDNEKEEDSDKVHKNDDINVDNHIEEPHSPDDQTLVKNQEDTNQNANSSESDQPNDTGSSHAKHEGINRFFGKIGSYLARDDAKDYQGVDLTAHSFAKHAFYIQGSSLAEGLATSIFGKKATTAQNLAHKFISEDRLTAVSESLYHKMAQLAQTWAVKSLDDDLKTLTPTQKDELAQNIANQNRLLATLGGVTGFFGLKGVVADTAWLLLVALRTVYQLASVYDVSLTGKNGIKMAYGVLSGANLDKMQEKQLILTVLALGGNMLTHAGQSSLKEELAKVSSSHAFFKELDDSLKLEKLADKYGIDVDKLNSSWLRHLASVSAVGVGAYYNRDLIDEVIGTAMATFKAKPIAGIEYQSDS